MRVLLTGATGFLGTHLTRVLEAAGHNVVPLSRTPGVGVDWSDAGLRAGIEGSDAIIHLAGENLFGGRWNAKRKAEILRSRVETTSRIAGVLAEKRGGTLIHASAVGYYGPRGNEEVDEESPPGSDFLAGVCKAWEEAARPAADAGARVVAVRIGVILGRGGGALARMLLPFKLGLGGRLGSGRQVFPWVHLHDLGRLFRFVLENESTSGAYNGTSPNPVTNEQFTSAMGRALHRPTFVPVPAFGLKLALGEAADVLLTGQRAVPKRALAAGFEFEFADLDAALRDLTS